jgi:hypothetical protein
VLETQKRDLREIISNSNVIPIKKIISAYVEKNITCSTKGAL